MKRRDLIRRLDEIGCRLIRHGGKHDWYQNTETGACQPVPRHNELKENLCRGILKKLSNHPK